MREGGVMVGGGMTRGGLLQLHNTNRLGSWNNVSMESSGLVVCIYKSVCEVASA